MEISGCIAKVSILYSVICHIIHTLKKNLSLFSIDINKTRYLRFTCTQTKIDADGKEADEVNQHIQEEQQRTGCWAGIIMDRQLVRMSTLYLNL